MSDAVASTRPGGWFLYLIRCRNGTLYTGITTDVERRFAEHQEGGLRAARYLRGKGPLELVYAVPAGDRASASSLEHKVKALTRAGKQNLITGVLNMQVTDTSNCNATEVKTTTDRNEP